MRIVICGGGVIGCTLAYFLTQIAPCDDIEVIVIEEIEIAAAASGKAGGFLASNWCSGEDVDPLCQLSFRLHRELADAIDGAKLYDYRQVSAVSCKVCRSRLKTRVHSSEIKIPTWARGEVVATSMMGTPETTAQVHPRKFTKCMMHLAISTGRVQLLNDRVEGIDGRSVRVTDGPSIPADAIVLAMGPWTLPALSKWLHFPQNIIPSTEYKIHSVVMGTASIWEPVVIFTDIEASSQEVEIVPRQDCTVYACGAQIEEPLPVNASLVEPNDKDIDDLLARVALVVNEENSLDERQACYLPLTTDGLPIIGQISNDIYVATGHGCWGILNSTGTAAALSELIINGSSTSIDLSPFSPERWQQQRNSTR